MLDLLDGLRGVRISELGKISSTGRSSGGAEKSRLQAGYMRLGGGRGEGQGQEGMEGVEGKLAVGADVEDGPDLGGVGELLG